MIYVTKFINALKTADLRELYSGKSLSSSKGPYIFNELASRNESVEIPREKRYNLSGDEDSDFADRELRSYSIGVFSHSMIHVKITDYYSGHNGLY